MLLLAAIKVIRALRRAARTTIAATEFRREVETGGGAELLGLEAATRRLDAELFLGVGAEELVFLVAVDVAL